MQPGVAALLAALDRRESDDVRELAAAYARVSSTTGRPIPPRRLSPAEQELASMRLIVVGSLIVQ